MIWVKFDHGWLHDVVSINDLRGAIAAVLASCAIRAEGGGFGLDVGFVEVGFGFHDEWRFAYFRRFCKLIRILC